MTTTRLQRRAAVAVVVAAGVAETRPRLCLCRRSLWRPICAWALLESRSLANICDRTWN